MDGAGRGDGVVFREAALVLFSCPGVCVVGGGVARNIASMSAVGVGVAWGVEVGWGVEGVTAGVSVAAGFGVA